MQLNAFILSIRLELNHLPEFNCAWYLHITRNDLEKVCHDIYFFLFLNLPGTKGANLREQFNKNMGVSDGNLKEKSWLLRCFASAENHLNSTCKTSATSAFASSFVGLHSWKPDIVCGLHGWESDYDTLTFYRFSRSKNANIFHMQSQWCLHYFGIWSLFWCFMKSDIAWINKFLIID